MIEKIVQYKTSDGKLFNSEEGAEYHESNVNHYNKLLDFLSIEWDSDIEEYNSIAEFLVNNSRQLKKFLSNINENWKAPLY